jgi:hypothetical protein
LTTARDGQGNLSSVPILQDGLGFAVL